MEEVDFSQMRRELAVASAPLSPRERSPASPKAKRTPEPRESEAYDALLDDDDSDIYAYEYRRKRRAGGYKPIQFVYAGQFSAPSDEEVEREWELGMAERRRWAASAKGPLLFNDRPRFAGLGSVKELPPYRQPASADESSAV